VTPPETAILHYTAPPVVGGVEAVIQAHARAFVEAGYPVTVVAGWGEASALPPGVGFVRIPGMDSRYELVAQLSAQLARGEVPLRFDEMVSQLVGEMMPVLSRFDHAIVHNLFTKHFNLPLTAALVHLLDAGAIRHCIAWCHDFTWTSAHSRSKVHPGYPWDLLRTARPDVTYVVVSRRRQRELAGLLGCPLEQILVVYDGVDPRDLLGLSAEGAALAGQLGLWQAELILLMPVRITQAKNVEYALQVVAALKSRDCAVKLILTGPPDPHDADSMAYYRSLQALRSELGVEREMRFVFESGPEPDQPYTVDAAVVGDLFRASDMLFMPSHREGFGMPVLEAGLVGLPVVCTDVPAAEEIGERDVMLFDERDDPHSLAERMLAWAAEDPVHRLRRRVRRSYTWPSIFERDIVPLLTSGEAPSGAP
jgi:glycosyltransferase involved in cell wall biosynthesis